MRERKKPTQSWVEKSKNEIEREEEYLAKRIELLNDIRIKKLLYQDSEAFKVGYEAGFAKACEMLHDFAKTVYEMRKRQEEERITRGWIMESSEGMTRHLRHLERRQNLEAEVDTWIQENYPHLMER